MKYLGLIELTTGRVTISDPCYEPGIWCAKSISVMPGSYLCFAEERNGRIESIQIRHAGHTEIEPATSIGAVAVDSGQCGFFDEAFYNKNQGGEFDNLNSFYGKACHITLSDEQAGIIDGKGFVSSSGWGDGMYQVFVGECNFLEHEDQITSVMLVFL
ncbi:MAG: DUF4241 domain-containing protein [Prevotella sp.]|nr:DUF4241 domain-containing protein [Prevotella sp.]